MSGVTMGEPSRFFALGKCDEAAHIDQCLKSSHGSVLFHWPQDPHGFNVEPFICFPEMVTRAVRR